MELSNRKISVQTDFSDSQAFQSTQQRLKEVLLGLNV